jgi:hypothetical protein
VLPAGTVVVLGGDPTAATDAGVDVAVAGEVGRWSWGGTLPGTLEEHYQMEQPQHHETLKWKAFPFSLMGWQSSGTSSMSVVVMAVGLS